MFLKNFYIVMAEALFGDNVSESGGSVVNYIGDSKVIASSSSLLSCDFQLCNNNVSSSQYAAHLGKISTSMKQAGVLFGDGDDPEAIDDYKLAGNIIGNITGIARITRDYDSDGSLTTRVVYTITNNNSNAVSIKEIGILGSISTGSSSSVEKYRCLLERTVLDAPVTIEAGGVGMVEYTLYAELPTA